jgi:DNA-binding winged helix-turn-helix (wHTH) protein
MLKLSDLALRPDLQLGPMLVSPSRRLVEGPGGHAHVEPLITQVFLLLLDAGGKVVTRNELFDQCWGGVMVGDDSLNRAIAKIRRTGAHVAPGLYEIETIPRTGYRLTGQILQFLRGDAATAEGEAPVKQWRSRRTLVAGGVAAAAGLGGVGLWSIRAREDQEFNELMARGEYGLERSDPGYNTQQYFRRAVALRPGDAKAQGQFAFALAVRAEYGGQDVSVLEEAERVARVALALDPNQPYARLALIIVRRSMLDFAATEDRVRAVLATDPDNIVAMRHLWALMQCVGRSRDALALIERALAVKPLAAGNHYPHAQLLWIVGRVAEADRVIDKAMEYWPSHRWVRWARFTILAFTGRPRAALGMLDNKETTPQNFSPEMISLWRISLAALDQRTPASIANAREKNLEAAKKDLTLTLQAAQGLSALGEVDAAFEVTNALFAVRRPAELHPEAAVNRQPAKSTAWRFAPWLFTPSTAPMRADPRFDALCEEIGLTEYWAKRGIKPDYHIYG